MLNKESIFLVFMLRSICHGDSSEEGPEFSLRRGKFVLEIIFARVIVPPSTINQAVCDKLCENAPICVAALYDALFFDCHLYPASEVVGAFFIQSENAADRPIYSDSDSDCSDCLAERRAKTCQKECAKNAECVSFSYSEVELQEPVCLLFNYDTSSLAFFNSSTAVFGLVTDDSSSK